MEAVLIYGLTAVGVVVALTLGGALVVIMAAEAVDDYRRHGW